MTSKDLTIADISHKRLIEEALPLSLGILIETMQLNPYETKEDRKTGKPIEVFNGRINSQRLKAALGTASLVERLGDQSLKRQAGGELREILKALKDVGHSFTGKKAPTIIEG